MPSYKNQLTNAIIQKAFNSQLQTKGQQYVQIQVLYRTLCKMKAANRSPFSKIKQNKFDHQIYDQILQESELIRVQDKVLVKMQNFVINLMRAQIALNEKLKSLHLHLQQIETKRREGQSLGRSGNKFDKRQEQIQQLKRELYELRVQRQQNELYLFDLRLVFMNEQELLRLTKQLKQSKSNPYYNIILVQYEDKSNKKSQQIHQTVDNKNSGQQLIQHRQRNIILNIIFWLSLTLLICELIIIIFVKNNYLNILVLVFIMSIFVREVYSKIIIKFILIINTGSILIEVIYIAININQIWYRNMSSLIQQISKHQYINYSFFCSYFIVIMIIILFGKLLLSLLLVVQICKKQTKQVRINCCFFSFNIKSIQSGISNDCLNNALIRSFL